MIIYNSMIVWIVVLGIWNKLVRQSKEKTQRFVQKQKDYKVPMYLAILTFGYIIFWVGMRSGVADTRAYISMFEGYPTSLAAIPQYWDFSENKSPGFITFSILFTRPGMRVLILPGTRWSMYYLRWVLILIGPEVGRYHWAERTMETVK